MSVKKEVLADLIGCDISKVNCPNCIYSRPFCGDAVTCGFWDSIEILHPDDFCSFFTLKEEKNESDYAVE